MNNNNQNFCRTKRVLKVNYVPKQCEHLHLYNIFSLYG